MGLLDPHSGQQGRHAVALVDDPHIAGLASLVASVCGRRCIDPFDGPGGRPSGGGHPVALGGSDDGTLEVGAGATEGRAVLISGILTGRARCPSRVTG